MAAGSRRKTSSSKSPRACLPPTWSGLRPSWGVSIDDFGVDYSALRYLKQFPVVELKIDQGFISHVTTSPQDAAITEAIIALARGLGLAVVAEGVETIGQLDFVRDRGCDAAQGFVLSERG